MSPGRRTKVQLAAVGVALAGATGATAVVAASSSPPAAGSSACTGGRWPVKTLADPEASRLVRTASPTTVQELRAASPPEVKGKSPRQTGWETHAVSVPVELVNGKLVHDGDLQLVVHAPGHVGMTMIAELPQEQCLHAGTSAADRADITSTRAQIVAACGPFTDKKKDLQGRVTLTGVRFLDTPHAGDSSDDNARGAAPDEVEVHPVLHVTGLQCSGGRT